MDNTLGNGEPRHKDKTEVGRDRILTAEASRKPEFYQGSEHPRSFGKGIIHFCKRVASN